MNSGEDEPTQPEDAGAAASEDMLRLVDAVDMAQEQELNRIDTALAAVEAADSREAAVAALTRATAGINTLYASTRVTPPLEIIAPSLNFQGDSSVMYSNFSLFHRRAENAERKRDERVERYLKVANGLVEKYAPDQYQLSVGFPLLISITLTWNLKKE
jgi:hypothetical protein